MPSSIPGFVMSDAQPLTARIGAQSQQGAPASLGRAAGSSSLVHDALRRIWRNPGAVAGAIVITAVILLAAFAPVIAPYDPIEQNSTAIRAGPSAEHLFGADNFGRDIFSRVLYGGRMSLPIGFVAIGITAVVGVALGFSWRWRWWQSLAPASSTSCWQSALPPSRSTHVSYEGRCSARARRSTW